MSWARWITVNAYVMMVSCALCGPAFGQVFIWGGQRDGLGAWGGATPGSGSPRYGGGWSYGGYGYGRYGFYGYPGFYGPRVWGTTGMSYSTFTVAGWNAAGPGPVSGSARVKAFPAVGVSATSPLLAVPTEAGPARVVPSCSRFIIQVPNCSSGCARIWVDGKLVCEKERVYRFETAALESGQYGYEIRAAWTDQAGQQRQATRNVTFQAGDVVPVDFTE